MTDNAPLYDLESVYDEKISPLMTRIIAICKEHKMPMVASFQYQRTEDDGEGLCTTALPFDERGTCDRVLKAIGSLYPNRGPRMSSVTVVKADGSTVVTMIADCTGDEP